MSQIGLYAHAVRAAQPRQLRARLLRPLRRRRFPAARPAAFERMEELTSLWQSPAFAHADEVALEDEVDVLGLRVPFPPPSWDLAGEPRLRRFHLHYGDEVLGWARRGEAERARAAVEAWTSGNPPAVGDAWHPYTLSQRVSNWIAAASLAPELATAGMVESLSQQARYLAHNIEEDILGNHVIANATALVLAGRVLDDGALLDRGVAVVRREAREQILPDGGHYERSPVYHSLVLRDLLVASAAAQLDWLDEPIERMRRFAAAARRPDGVPAAFNDGPVELAPELDLPATADGAAVFEDTGYVFVREGTTWLAFDCGPPGPPFLPAHAHADALSIQLWHGGTPLVVDPGTFTYDGGEDRDWFRSTRAHATATVDGREQFVSWGAFRAGPLPNVRLLGEAPLAAEASYDGVLHRRTLEVGDGAVVVHDESKGHVEARFPLAREQDLGGADRWDEGWRSERMFERERIPVAVGSGAGSVTVRVPLVATL